MISPFEGSEFVVVDCHGVCVAYIEVIFKVLKLIKYVLYQRELRQSE